MAGKRVFLIHGWGGGPEGGWFSWLKKELESRGFEVIAPEMPNTDEPKIEEWVPFLSKLAGAADEKTYFIGHSIGCQAILRYLEKIYPSKTGGAVFVAGWFNLKDLEGPEEEKIASPWLETPVDLPKVKDSANKFTAIFSDNDPFVPLSDADIFKEKLGAEIVFQKGKGHFSGDDGVSELPAVLEKLLKMAE